jgi:hypothetical protein
MLISWVFVASFAFASLSFLPPPPASMPAKQLPPNSGRDGAVGASEVRVPARRFLGLATGASSRATTSDREAWDVGGAAESFDSFEIMGAGRIAGCNFVRIGNAVAVYEMSDAGGVQVGSIVGEEGRLAWNWSEAKAPRDAGVVQKLVQALCGVELRAIFSGGITRQIRFIDDSEEVSPPQKAADSGTDSPRGGASPAPTIPRAPFRPDADPLGDIRQSVDSLIRLPSRVTSFSVITLDPAAGVCLTQESPTEVVVSCKRQSGQMQVLGSFTASDMTLSWNWRRIDARKFGASLGAFQDLVETMTIDITTADGTQSHCLEPDDSDGAGPVEELPGSRDDGKLTTEDRRLLQAIRVAEQQFSEEAAAWSRARQREIQSQRDAARRARDASRKARNAQQRYEEKYGWTDRYGNRHAGDGHTSRSQDDRKDGVRKARPGGGVSGGIVLKGAWGALMASEVEAESSAKRSSKDGEWADRMLSEAGLPDSERIRDFLGKWMGCVTDARIRKMLSTIRSELDASSRRSGGDGSKPE